MRVLAVFISSLFIFGLHDAVGNYDIVYKKMKQVVAAKEGGMVEIKMGQENFLRDKLQGINLKDSDIQVTYNLSQKNVRTSINLPNQPRPLVMNARVIPVIEIPVLGRAIAVGSIVSEKDIEYQRVPVQQVNKDILSSAVDIIGLQAKRSQTPNKALKRNDFIKPRLVKKNELVTVQAKAPNLIITTQAKALEDGGKGEVVQVQNIKSKKVIQALVTDFGRAESITAVDAYV